MPVVSLTVPKHSNPLEKSVRTLEGVLVLVSNIALVVIPVVTSVGPGVSLKYGAILNGAYAIARSLLKGLAMLGSHGVLPAPVQILAPATQKSIEAAVVDAVDVAKSPLGASVLSVITHSAPVAPAPVITVAPAPVVEAPVITVAPAPVAEPLLKAAVADTLLQAFVPKPEAFDLGQDVPAPAGATVAAPPVA